MLMPMLRRVARAIIAASALTVPLAAMAVCTREIRVPVAPTGASVIITGNVVSGAFPDMLRELGDKLGCHFVFPIVPRARMSFMFFTSGEADLMLPASRSAERERDAIFIPLMSLKVALVTLHKRDIHVSSVPQLLADHRLQGVTVRSYVFGDEYNAVVKQLEADKRLSYVNDLVAVARMLKAGRSDFTLLSPSILVSSLGDDPDLAGFRQQLAYTQLDGMPATESGAYISKKSLSPQDQATLRELLETSRKGALLRNFQKYYPADMAQFYSIW